MLDVLGGVAHLHLGERALQPVGAGFVLRQVDAEDLQRQLRVAHRKRHAEIRGGQLGIEQRLRQAAGQALEHFEVFAAGMEYLDHFRRFQHGGERRPVTDQQRIDQPRPLAVAHLHQAGCRVEGIDTHELGIDCEVRPLFPVVA
ncbi:hypothetical protein FQZ97_1128280 [compost metagenome]